MPIPSVLSKVRERRFKAHLGSYIYAGRWRAGQLHCEMSREVADAALKGSLRRPPAALDVMTAAYLLHYETAPVRTMGAGGVGQICGSFNCNWHTAHLLKVSHEGSYSLVPRRPLRWHAGAFRAVTIRKDGGEFYKAAQSFVEFDALHGRLGSFAVLLCDSPCQVLTCRVDSLTYRRRRRQRGRHHRQARAHVAQIECWIANSRHRPVDQTGEMTPPHQDIGGPEVTVDD